MNVEESKDMGEGHSIEFGTSTWDENTKSVRNRYPTKNGGFSPRSSSEIPLQDIPLIVKEGIELGYFVSGDFNMASVGPKPKLGRIKSSIIKWYEVLSLVLLLLGFGAQTLFVDVTSISNETDLYQLHEKVDAVWNIVAAEYAKKYPSELTGTYSRDIDFFMKNYSYWGEMKKEKELVESQISLFQNIHFYFYLSASLLFLLGKSYEIKYVKYGEFDLHT